jgi:hypothetical protein
MTYRPHSGRKWIAVAGALLLLVLITGDWIREAIDPELRIALWFTGAGLFGISTLGYILSPDGLFGVSASAWVKMVGSAALVGFLLFVLFVQGVECQLHSSGRRIATVCKEVES